MLVLLVLLVLLVVLVASDDAVVVAHAAVKHTCGRSR